MHPADFAQQGRRVAKLSTTATLIPIYLGSADGTRPSRAPASESTCASGRPSHAKAPRRLAAACNELHSGNPRARGPLRARRPIPCAPCRSGSIPCCLPSLYRRHQGIASHVAQERLGVGLQPLVPAATRENVNPHRPDNSQNLAPAIQRAAACCRPCTDNRMQKGTPVVRQKAFCRRLSHAPSSNAEAPRRLPSPPCRLDGVVHKVARK